MKQTVWLPIGWSASVLCQKTDTAIELFCKQNFKNLKNTKTIYTEIVYK